MSILYIYLNCYK